MKPILKQRLAILGAAAGIGGAMLTTTRPAMAQETPPPNKQSFRAAMGVGEPRVALTRDMAAQKFLLLLQSLSALSNASSGPEAKPNATNLDAAMMSSFSRSSEDDNLPVLLLKLSKQIGQADQSVTVQNEGDKVATVVVETKSRPLVLVQEGESWGVDVGETFA